MFATPRLVRRLNASVHFLVCPTGSQSEAEERRQSSFNSRSCSCVCCSSCSCCCNAWFTEPGKERTETQRQGEPPDLSSVLDFDRFPSLRKNSFQPIVSTDRSRKQPRWPQPQQQPPSLSRQRCLWLCPNCKALTFARPPAGQCRTNRSFSRKMANCTSERGLALGVR